MKIKTIHGHYSDKFEDEARRIVKMYKEILNIDLSWNEATAIAGMRSQTTFWSDKKLKDIIAQLRGL